MASTALNFIAADKSWAQIADAAQTGLDFGTGDFSFAVLAKWTSLPSLAVLLRKLQGNVGWELVSLSNGSLRLYFGDGTLISADSAVGTVGLNTFYSIVVVCNRAGNAVVYVNGTSVLTLDISARSGSVSNSNAFAVGSFEDSGGSWFNGVLGYIRVASRAWTPAEIARQANVNGSTPQARPYAQLTAAERVNLQGCWDEPQATFDNTHQWLDLSGNSNHLSFAAGNIIDATTLNGGMETVTAGTEAITNPGFEIYTGTQDDGTSDSFTGWVSVSTGGVIEATATKASGTNAVKVARTTASVYLYQQSIPVVAGTAYRLSMSTRGDGTNAGRYQIYDHTNASYLRSMTSTGVTGTSYSTVTYDFQLPANCVSIKVELYSPEVNGGVAYFDNVSLKPLSPATWTKSENGASKVQIELSAPYAGTYGVRLDVDGSNTAVYVSQTSMTNGKRYTATAYSKVSSTVNSPTYRLGTSASSEITIASSSVYTQDTSSFTANSTDFSVRRASNCNSRSIYLDNITLTAAEVLTIAGPSTTVAASALARRNRSRRAGSRSYIGASF